MQSLFIYPQYLCYCMTKHKPVSDNALTRNNACISYAHMWCGVAEKMSLYTVHSSWTGWVDNLKWKSTDGTVVTNIKLDYKIIAHALNDKQYCILGLIGRPNLIDHFPP